MRFSRLLLSIVCIIIFSAPLAQAETVTLPINLDYSLLRALFSYKVYTAPGNKAIAYEGDDGCTKIELWNPEFSPEGEHLKLGSMIRIKAGVPVGQNCIAPVDWEGFIEILQEVRIDPETWGLHFKVVDSRLFDKNRQRGKVKKVLWDLVKTKLHDHLNKKNLNLAPPVEELHGFLPAMFPPEDRGRVGRWLESMRPGRIVLEPMALKVELLMDVEVRPKTTTEVSEELLTQAEFDQVVKLWESWDAFLIHQIEALSGKPLTDSERQEIFETVLTARYNFVAALTTMQPGRDLVRQQFVESWRRLSPIFRRYLADEPSPSVVGYLAFFTASDALAALDKLGPTLGVEISRNGLIRLARLVTSGRMVPALAYNYEVNQEFRTVLGLGPALAETGPAFETETIQVEDILDEEEITRRLLDLLFPKAWAAGDPAKQGIKGWLVTSRNFSTYLPKVRKLLAEEADKVLAESRLDPKYHDLYRIMVQAFSWQESCFRQFRVKKGRATYLRSYDNSSVGLMQINERVWRKIYKRNSLRWNIRYNARAGCRILERYLVRYAVPRLEKQGIADPDTLPRLTYALYNGGPSQYKRFMKRHAQAKYWKIDLLFWEKYNWARLEQWEKVSKCLLGR